MCAGKTTNSHVTKEEASGDVQKSLFDWLWHYHHWAHILQKKKQTKKHQSAKGNEMTDLGIRENLNFVREVL